MLQLSVGPVFFTVLHLSIKKGLLEGLKMTCAVALVDAFYLCLSFTSISVLLQIPQLETIISMMSMLVLIYFGLAFIINSKNKSYQAIVIKGNSFIYGIKITLINPITIVFWSGTFGSLIASHRLTGFVSTVHYALGCISATLIFLGFTSLLGKSLNSIVDINKLRFIDYAIGMILIIFAVKNIF